MNVNLFECVKYFETVTIVNLANKCNKNVSIKLQIYFLKKTITNRPNKSGNNSEFNIDSQNC